MAAKTIALNDAATKNLWSKRVGAEAVWKSIFLNPTYNFAGKDPGNMIVLAPEFQGHGNKLTCTLTYQLTGDGTVDGAPIEGQESSYQHFTHEFEVHELTSEPYGQKSQLDEQHVEWDVAQRGKDAVKTWWHVPLNTAFMFQGCGYNVTAATDYYKPNGRQVRYTTDRQYSGMNDVTAIQSGRISRANGESTDQALTTEATHKMKLEYIEDFIARAVQRKPPIAPARWAGGENWFLFLHTDQARDLTEDSRYQNIEDAMLQGGMDFSKSMWGTGNFRPYKGVVIIVSNWNPPGIHSSTGAAVANTRRALFCGAGAFGLGFGVGHGQNRFRFHQEKYNVGGSYRCVARSIWGASRIDYNSLAYGCEVLTTYAANKGDA